MNDPAPGLGSTQAEIIRAERVFESAWDGGFFSTGSIVWAGLMSHADYKNCNSRCIPHHFHRSDAVS